MKYTFIAANEFATSQWAGGTTTEFFIFPPHATYQKRDFIFRLSSATVEQDESKFTHLPRFSRKLMLLEGEILVSHENKYTKKLRKFDVDEFDGGWKTSSIGRCIDFNLMTNEFANGSLSYATIEKQQEFVYAIESFWNWVFVYVNSGSVLFECQKEIIESNRGDLFMIEKPNISTIKFKNKAYSELIFVNILV